MRTSPTSSRGLTIIEMVAATAVLSVVLAFGLGGMASSVDTTNHLTHTDDLRRRCFAVTDRIANQLGAAEKGVVAVTAGTLDGKPACVLAFAENIGFDTELEQIDFGPLRQVSRQGDALVLQLDADLDGAIGPGDTTVELTRDVVGFEVSPAEAPLASDHVDITLTLQRQLGLHEDGSPWLATVTSHRRVFLRESE